MRITMEQLEQWGACNLDECRPFVGDGLELTGAAIMAAHEAGVLHADWLAERVLSGRMRAEYEEARSPALAEWKRAEKLAWAECCRVMASAATAAKWEHAVTQAWAEYDRAIEPLLAEYQRATALVLATIIDAQAGQEEMR